MFPHSVFGFVGRNCKALKCSQASRKFSLKDGRQDYFSFDLPQNYLVH